MSISKLKVINSCNILLYIFLTKITSWWFFCKPKLLFLITYKIFIRNFVATCLYVLIKV
jgi:hypothetical protein